MDQLYERYTLLFIMIIGIPYFILFVIRKRVKWLLEDIPTNYRYYPKQYAFPPRWMCKFFYLKYRMMPKVLIVEAYWHVGDILILVLVFLVFLFSGLSYDSPAGIIWVVWTYIRLPSIIINLIIMLVIKHNVPKEEKEKRKQRKKKNKNIW